MIPGLSNTIDKLIKFALDNDMIGPIDVPYVRNQIIDLFGVDTFEETALPSDWVSPPTATPILQDLLEYAVELGRIENTVTNKELFDTRIMGCLVARPSDIIAKFKRLYMISPRQATQWFYELSRKSNYIRVDDVARNILWPHDTADYGRLEITINLSKPEKDPKEIAKLKSMPQAGYPKCMLCKDNVGYAGRLNFPARQTLRTIPLELNSEPWYMQYSPYVYYDQHCIVFKEQHVPMRIERSTFTRLMQFTDQFPHYFIGSNADLPIVGGSILNHDHFQGGAHILPMAKAPMGTLLQVEGHPGVQAGIVKWPMSALRLCGTDIQELTELADRVLCAWREYSDPAADIMAYTEQTPHNTVTPIARKRDGKYELDLVLRNNRTSEEHPLGIFHPHSQLHHIKRENIGLIEVMGLFILPGRLKDELLAITDILAGNQPYNMAELQRDESHPLHKHSAWIESMALHYGTFMDAAEAKELVYRQVGEICEQVLRDAGVYKDTPEGRAAFLRFLSTVGMEA